MPCGQSSDTCKFAQAHARWIAGDLAGFMDLMDEDILWEVNADGSKLPYASSALGKEDLRWRLTHMTDVFRVDMFHVDWLRHETDACRSQVRLVYVHRRTGEALVTINRFTGWLRDGRLVRVEERIDKAYVEAFDRFVRYLEDDGA